jgi:hypothetical protein
MSAWSSLLDRISWVQLAEVGPSWPIPRKADIEIDRIRRPRRESDRRRKIAACHFAD